MVGSEAVGEAERYTLQSEAQKIFESIVKDSRLSVPNDVQNLMEKVDFVGDETKPFYPVPYKCAETQAALLGYIGVLGLAISKDRYGIEQRVEVDVAHALLNGLGALFTRHEGDWLSGNSKMIEAVKRWDHGNTRELYRQLATNIYKTKDGQWFSLHGSMDPTPLLEMLQIPQHDGNDLTWEEILQMYAKLVGEIDSAMLDSWCNNVYRTPGTICLKEEAFRATPHGEAIKDEPYYNLISQPYYKQPPAFWNDVAFDSADYRPLSGIKILELARAIAGPTIGKVCASLGATVIRVSCSKNAELPITLMEGCLGKTSVDVDLKTFQGRKKLLNLIRDADVFIDGYRPSVLEHLGFGRDAVLGLTANRKKGIVYCQENCYGWRGPWMVRPGWAQIADTVTGVGYGIGAFHGFDEPQIFAGPNVDYLTGHAGAAGILHALYSRAHEGGSFVVQCSLLVSNLHMQSYGKYNEDQQMRLKARNKGLVGQIRHYDEIVSHGKKEHAIRGFVADRAFEKAFKKEYFQTTSGQVWGLGNMDVVASALKYKAESADNKQDGMRTDYPVEACPPGYHLPEWERMRNMDFQSI